VQPFVHDRLHKLQHLLQRCSDTLGVYNRLEFNLAAAVTGFLDEAITAHRALQLATAENALLALLAQFVSAEQGTHPDTLLRSTGHRRELLRAIALRVLQHSAEQLRAAVEKDQQRLAEARRQLQPLVLLALRDGLIKLPVRKRLSQRGLQLLWRALLQAPDSALAARQLAMQSSPYDILLLLGEQLELAVTPPPPPRPWPGPSTSV